MDPNRLATLKKCVRIAMASLGYKDRWPIKDEDQLWDSPGVLLGEDVGIYPTSVKVVKTLGHHERAMEGWQVVEWRPYGGGMEEPPGVDPYEIGDATFHETVAAVEGVLHCIRMHLDGTFQAIHDAMLDRAMIAAEKSIEPRDLPAFAEGCCQVCGREEGFPICDSCCVVSDQAYDAAREKG